MSIQSELKNIGNGFFSVIFIVLIIIVLAEIGIAFGMQDFTNQLINSLGLLAILILAIPPIGLIIAIVVFIVKCFQPEISV